jgi:hypothetical protein
MGFAPLHAPMDGTSRGALRCAQDTPSAQSVIPAELVLVETGSGNPERPSEGHALSWPRSLASQNRAINPRTPNLGGLKIRVYEGHPQTPGSVPLHHYSTAL